MSEAWRINASDACIEVRVNGRIEKVNRGTINDLGDFISGKAAAAGIGKASVYVDGNEVEPEDIGDYSVDDIKTIDIKTYDIVRC